jgi:hypothetical protein
MTRNIEASKIIQPVLAFILLFIGYWVMYTCLYLRNDSFLIIALLLTIVGFIFSLFFMLREDTGQIAKVVVGVLAMIIAIIFIIQVFINPSLSGNLMGLSIGIYVAVLGIFHLILTVAAAIGNPVLHLH